MRIAVFDTYVKKSNGNTAHFDIMVPEGNYNTADIIKFGKIYLEEIGESGNNISAKECQFCHIEEPTDEMLKDISNIGYFILELEDIPSSLPDHPTRRNLIQHLRAVSEVHRFANFRGVSDEEIRSLIM